MTISPDQCRAARAFLNWSQPKLAEAAGVSRETVINFERGVHTPHANNMAALRTALESAGVVFLDETRTRGPGVCLRK